METNNKKQGDVGLSSSHDTKPVEITIILPTQTYFISGIRDFTLNLIKNMTDFGEQWAYRFQSIVDELCNNAIEHGSSSEDSITIVFQHTPEYIQILVSDHGSGKSHLKAEEIKGLVDDRKNHNVLSGMIRGRGLPKIVSEWTDELEFVNNSDGGITVRVRKYLNYPQVELKTYTSVKKTTNIILNV